MEDPPPPPPFFSDHSSLDTAARASNATTHSIVHVLMFSSICVPLSHNAHNTGFKDVEALRKHLVDNLIGSCVWGLTFMYIRKMANPELRATAWKNRQVGHGWHAAQWQEHGFSFRFLATHPSTHPTHPRDTQQDGYFATLTTFVTGTLKAVCNNFAAKI